MLIVVVCFTVSDGNIGTHMKRCCVGVLFDLPCVLCPSCQYVRYVSVAVVHSHTYNYGDAVVPCPIVSASRSVRCSNPRPGKEHIWMCEGMESPWKAFPFESQIRTVFTFGLNVGRCHGRDLACRWLTVLCDWSVSPFALSWLACLSLLFGWRLCRGSPAADGEWNSARMLFQQGCCYLVTCLWHCPWPSNGNDSPPSSSCQTSSNVWRIFWPVCDSGKC